MAWIQEAINEVEFLITDPMIINEFFGAKGIVTFAFTRQGAQIENVLELLIAAFKESSIPVIVSWITSSGQVMYMGIGKASACAALGDLARQIACAQQNQHINCNAQEVDWRGEAWEAPPPDESKGAPVVQWTP